MAETKRYAVVTGSNKGIGLEIVRQLASQGVVVVLTARDATKGAEAVEQLKESGLSDVVFCQLDVTDSTSIASCADFVKAQFGKLDILVNNAAITGATVDWNTLRDLTYGLVTGIKPEETSTETFELAEECFKTNYYGVKEVTVALIPLLQLSNSARIVNLTSSMGLLKNIPDEEVKRVLSDVDGLTEEKVDEIVTQFLQDFKEMKLEAKGWKPFFSAYTISKAALNAYTRILAKKFPTFFINCVCPGSVKTDINGNTGIMTLEEGASGPVRLALLADNVPSGLFFSRTEESTF